MKKIKSISIKSTFSDERGNEETIRKSSFNKEGKEIEIWEEFDGVESITTFVYDPNNKLIEESTKDGGIESFKTLYEYEKGELVKSTMIENGEAFQYILYTKEGDVNIEKTFDLDGTILSSIISEFKDGDQIRHEFRGANNVMEFATEFVFDQPGVLSKQLIYSSEGEVVEIQMYQYNAEGEIELHRKLDANEEFIEEIHFEYEKGLLVKETWKSTLDLDYETVESTYDSHKLPISEIAKDEKGSIVFEVFREYDAYQNPTKVSKTTKAQFNFETNKVEDLKDFQTEVQEYTNTYFD